MEAELKALAQHGHFQDLLTRTSAILISSPEDELALAYQARALASLHRYEEACPVLSKAIRYCTTPKRLSAMKELKTSCVRLCMIVAKYDRYAALLSTFPKDWYGQVLTSAVALQESEAFASGFPSLEYKIKRERELNRGVTGRIYILGPICTMRYEKSFDEEDYKNETIENFGAYPRVQCDEDWLIYTKRYTYPVSTCSDYYSIDPKDVRPMAVFPTVSWEHTGPVVRPNTECDVWHSTQLVDATTQRLLTWSLDKLAKERQDYFEPMNQRIIDPCKTAMRQVPEPYAWTATEFVIEEVRVTKTEVVIALQGCVRRIIGRGLPWHSSELILSYAGSVSVLGKAHLASPLPELPIHDNKELAISIESILTAACPLLAECRRPALLLPGKLQVVVKAHSLHLQPGNEYTEVWHSDGNHENIVAAVVYYYRFSPGMQGGDLEFISRRFDTQDFGLHGKVELSYLSRSSAKSFINSLPYCRVPMQQGTLVVFSNYQLVHRVLAMKNTSKSIAYCDYLVLYIVDQRKPLESTSYLDKDRTRVASENQRAIQYKYQYRVGKFGISDKLACVNDKGAVSKLGWMESPDYYADIQGRYEDQNGIEVLNAISVEPPLGEGIAWNLQQG